MELWLKMSGLKTAVLLADISERFYMIVSSDTGQIKPLKASERREPDVSRQEVPLSGRSASELRGEAGLERQREGDRKRGRKETGLLQASFSIGPPEVSTVLECKWRRVFVFFSYLESQAHILNEVVRVWTKFVKMNPPKLPVKLKKHYRDEV